jgi:ATP-dependent DNA helicase RecG
MDTKALKAEFIEGNPFKTIIPLPAGTTAGEKGGEKGGDRLTANQVRILELIGSDSFISAKELATQVGITQRKIEQNLAGLKQKGRLRRVGPDKGGHWEVLGREGRL